MQRQGKQLEIESSIVHKRIAAYWASPQASLQSRRPVLFTLLVAANGRVCFGITYTKIGTIQRRLAWPLRKDDTQIREAFQIFYRVQLGGSSKTDLRDG